MMSMPEQHEWLPYVIVWACACTLVVLFRIRRGLLHQDNAVPKIEIGNGQTIGAREEQDDYFSTFVSPHGTIAVLADGISGLSGGRAASTAAVTTFVKQFLKLEHIRELPEFFTTAAAASNAEIMHTLKGAQGGTTLVAVVVEDGNLHWGAVGDSLIKIFRNGDFIDVNQKHILESVLEERFVSGEITRDEALESPMKNHLVNYLGYEGFKNIEIGTEPVRLQKRDKVILCSDGVYNTLTEVELEDILSKPISAYDAAEEIIEAIERKQLTHQDNATVVILEKGW